MYPSREAAPTLTRGRRPLILLSLSIVVVAAVVGCSGATATSSQSSGALAMEFVTELPGPCVEQCALPRRTLSNTHVVLAATARGPEASMKLRAVSSDTLVMNVTADSVSCDCDNDPTQPNREDATCEQSTKVCRHLIDVTTVGAGVATINMNTEDGTLVDSFPMAVREAVGLLAEVRAAGPKQTRPGRSLVFRGEAVIVAADPVDADGERLVHDPTAERLATTNAAVLAVRGPDSALADAMNLGSATLSVSIGGASTTLDVDVVAR